MFPIDRLEVAEIGGSVVPSLTSFCTLFVIKDVLRVLIVRVGGMRAIVVAGRVIVAGPDFVDFKDVVGLAAATEIGRVFFITVVVVVDDGGFTREEGRV